MKQFIIKLSKSEFVRGSVFFTIASFAVSVVNYLFNFLVAHNFPLSSYGEYSSVLSYFALLSVPFTAFSAILVKRLGRVSSHERSKFGLKLESWLFFEIKNHSLQIISLAFAIFGLIAWRSNLFLVSVGFLVITLICQFLYVFYTAVLQAQKKFVILATIGMMLALTKVAVGLGVVFFAKYVWALYVAIIISQLVSLVVGYRSTRVKSKYLKVKSNHDHQFLPIYKYLSRKSIYLPLFATLALIAFSSSDVILAKKFLSPDDVGLYGALSLLGKIILYLTTPVAAVAYSYFTASEDEHDHLRIILLTSLGVGALGLVSTLLYANIPGLIVNIIFGSNFVSIVPLVWLTAVIGFSYSMVMVFTQYWMARDSYISLISLAGAAVQASILYLYHPNISTFLLINATILGILVLIYLITILYSFLPTKDK